MVGAVLAGVVLGAFLMATLVVVAINRNQSPSEPTYEPIENYRIGGDAKG